MSLSGFNTESGAVTGVSSVLGAEISHFPSMALKATLWFVWASPFASFPVSKPTLAAEDGERITMRGCDFPKAFHFGLTLLPLRLMLNLVLTAAGAAGIAIRDFENHT